MDSSLPLQSLLERLMGATGPDERLGAEVVCALLAPPGSYVTDYNAVFTSPCNLWHDDREPGQPNPYHVTASIDAAVDLKRRLLPDAPLLMGEAQTPETQPWARVGIWREPDATGATLALAVCASLLQALIASKSPSETET